MTTAIAVVGMACLYPDARTPVELWENVLAQRRSFRRLPAERLRLDDYWSADPHLPDHTYATEAALIEGYEFDRVRFRVAGATFRTADFTHWLALDIAAQALADAGFGEGEGLPRTATGVLVGNTLTGEFSRANGMRLRWPYVRRVVEAALVAQAWPPERRLAFLQELETQYKAPFPPIGEESLAGGLSNTIAGRICNYFNLNGGGYTVDGACASSLLAIATACSALTAGDLDVALAGGVDLSLDPFELVGFAKTGALAPEEMRVYDARSNGFWPGEGCGFVVLMRHAEAMAQRRRIYALIPGWGISSDGSGGITRPEVEGQMLALQRAYRRAGFGQETVAYFEGHGTGTTVGDATELRMLSLARRTADPTAPPAVISSLKGNIGHTKAAAGVAGFIKAVMALYTQILPPTTGCQTPHPVFHEPSPALRILTQAEPWLAHEVGGQPHQPPLRAGVSAMGFGGINTHIVLEGSAPPRQKTLNAHERLLRTSPQDGELFLLNAKDAADLQRQIEHLLGIVPQISYAEMADLAAQLQRTLGNNLLRAAIVAAHPAEFVSRLQTLQAWLKTGATRQLDFHAHVFLGAGVHTPRLGFLFPGQSAPVYTDGGALGRRFAFVADLYTQANCNWAGRDCDRIATAVAQPAILTATLAALRVLDHLALKAHVAVGHSLGELSALHWAGVLDEQALLRIATLRGQLMTECGHSSGMMAQIGADDATVKTLLNGHHPVNNGHTSGVVTIACLNSPNHTVISGAATAVSAIVAQARARGLHAEKLSVSHAFHSPLMAAVAQPFAALLAGEDFQPLRSPVISTVTGDFLSTDANLRTLLEQQVTAPVRFTEAVTRMAEQVDCLIEVGPGRVLSGLIPEWVNTPVAPFDAGGPSLCGLLQVLGAAFALGAPFNHAALFRDRFTRPFSLDYQPRFFVNPCELAPMIERSLNTQVSAPLAPVEPLQAESLPALPEPTTVQTPGEDSLSLVRRLVAERAELPLSAIRDSDRLLSELHLNSLTVSQLVAEAARRLKRSPPIAPTEYADVTVATVAQALQELPSMEDGAFVEAARQAASGVDTWVRAFTVKLVERPQPRRPATTAPGGWQVIAPAGHRLAASLQQAFARAAGSGVVVCLPPHPDEGHLPLLLVGVHTLLSQQGMKRFVLVQHGGGAAALARTLHLEVPESTTCIVDVPIDHASAVDWVVSEATTTAGYTEVHYDLCGRRYEPVLQLLPSATASGQLPLGPSDVLLVTGGGKGITAECALSLARASGARLALFGRSHPEHDAELAANLRRMSAAGLDFRYIVTDITQADEVYAAVQTVQQAFGPITAILHGAARNAPQRLQALDEVAFQRTLAPKLQGARNLLAAINPHQLRLFVTFGSIIARTGLPGEADYGLANEWLVRLTEQFQTAHPTCRCLAVEWSVWAGAGMGERLGQLDSLVRQGIMPIPIDQGIAMLHHLLAEPEQAAPPALPVSVVVAGRFGAPPTLQVEGQELPFLRFLEQVRVHYPRVELVVDTLLSVDTDPYLADHVFRGERLLPAVIGLEAMAQAAMALMEAKGPPVFENVRFDRPVVVSEKATVSIRIAALVCASGRVEVALRSEETAFQVDHFRATCDFGPRTVASEEDLSVIAPPLTGIEPHRDLYGGLLFQRGRFQRLKNYRHITAKACVAEIAPDNSQWFGHYLPAALVLGDPGARDAAIHAIQVCIPQATLLPIGLESLTLNGAHDPGPRFVQARERSWQGDTFIYDVDVTDAEGHCVEGWQGLQLRAVDGAYSAGPWPTSLLGPTIQRWLEGVWPKKNIRVAVERYVDTPRQLRSDVTIQHALGEAMPVQRRLDGKPEVTADCSVSAAHMDDLTLAVVSSGPIGCDLERVTPHTEVVWQDLLGLERFKLAEIIAQMTHQDLATAATRVWTAGECLKKAGAALHAPLLFVSASAEGLVLMASGAFCLATLVTQAKEEQVPFVVAVAVRENDASL